MKKKNLFISWSGELSKHIAEELKKFFEETLQNMEPFFSPDIQKGTGWLEKINKAINNSTAGILCLTNENNMKPWVLFESGALSRVGVVCPIVFDMGKENIKSPLNIFQAAEFNKKEFKKLFEDISMSCGTDLHQKVIDRIFEDDGRYDILENKIKAILSNYSAVTITKDETLELLNKIDRKITNLVTEKDSSSIDFNYLEMLVDSFSDIFSSLSPEFKSIHKEMLQKMAISIDYLISQKGENKSLNGLLAKNEQINKDIEAL